jgi:predicted nucleic-acid-binding Zn-ribbon protein
MLSLYCPNGEVHSFDLKSSGKPKQGYGYPTYDKIPLVEEKVATCLKCGYTVFLTITTTAKTM